MHLLALLNKFNVSLKFIFYSLLDGSLLDGFACALCSYSIA